MQVGWRAWQGLVRGAWPLQFCFREGVAIHWPPLVDAAPRSLVSLCRSCFPRCIT